MTRFLKWEYTGLCLMVLVTLILHFVTIMSPRELVFDEQHYIGDARSVIADNGTLRMEHPPLARFFIVNGVRAFGDNPFGWRFPAVIFGTLGIILFYFICRALRMSNTASNLATFLFAFENLNFLQASVAMLDVFNVTFMLLTFWLYIRGSYMLSGISVGLTTLTKLTGALAAPAIFFHWIFARRTRIEHFLLLVLISPLSFLVFLPVFDWLASGQLINPIEHIKNMLTLSSSLTFASVTHPAASRPWDWVIRPEVMYYWYTPHYIGAVSFNVWAFIVPTVVYMAILGIRRGTPAAVFGLSWFAGTYLLWIPLSIITDRISYMYYFYPTVGAICLGLGYGLAKLLGVWKSRRRGKLAWAALIGVSVFLAAHLVSFVILTPFVSQWVDLIPHP